MCACMKFLLGRVTVVNNGHKKSLVLMRMFAILFIVATLKTATVYWGNKNYFCFKISYDKLLYLIVRHYFSNT